MQVGWSECVNQSESCSEMLARVVSMLCAPLIFFFVLGLSKMVSISSMIALISATIIAFITFKNTTYAILILILTILVIFRHTPNIKRIIKGKENKISFIK